MLGQTYLRIAETLTGLFGAVARIAKPPSGSLDPSKIGNDYPKDESYLLPFSPSGSLPSAIFPPPISVWV